LTAEGPGKESISVFKSHQPMVVLLFAALIVSGCAQSGPTSTQRFLEDALVHARIYQRRPDYEVAKWLEAHVLCRGMSKETVEKLLGEGDQWPHLQSVMYDTWRDSALGSGILVIRYRNGLVEGWEWADE
jgi:hypothetical protein